jgi:hypothetical protein
MCGTDDNAQAPVAPVTDDATPATDEVATVEQPTEEAPVEETQA